MNPIIESLWARKSIRVYEDRPISDGDVRLILDAALQAPSAGNMALFSIVQAKDQALKDSLAVSCDDQSFIANAPLVLIFLADYQRWYDTFRAAGAEPRNPAEGDLMLAACDALIAAQNTVVAAEALGIGSCYIGDILERYEYHKQLLNLPQYALPVAMLCYGYPTQQQRQRTKPRRLDARDILHENAYRVSESEELKQMLAQQQGKPAEEMDAWIEAFCARKYNSDFSLEMSRSVREMIRCWCAL